MIEMITVAVSGVHPRHLIQDFSAPNLEDQKIDIAVILSSEWGSALQKFYSIARR